MQLAGLTVTAVLLAKLLERYAGEQALLLALLTGTLLTAASVKMLLPVLNQIDALMLRSGLSSAQTALIAKAAGICCVTQLAADLCRDAGHSALCSAVTLAGKTALLLLCIPLIDPLLHLITEVMTCISGG